MAQATNNVIMFPTDYANIRVPPPQSVAEIDSNLKLIHHLHAQETLQVILGYMFHHLKIAGFQFDTFESVEDQKCASFVAEAVHAILLKKYGINHPFQELIDKVFEEKEGTLAIVDHLDITLPKSVE